MVAPIRSTGPVMPQAPAGAVAPVAAAQPTATGPRVDPREAAARLMVLREDVVKALEKGDGPAAAQALAEGRALAERAQASTTDPALKAAFAEAKQAFDQIGRQAIQAAPPPPAEAAPPAEKRNKGMFGFIGGLLDQGGALLEKGARLVTYPLTLLGKGLDFVKEPLGKALGGLKTAIDESVGQIPVIGQAVRFTTGLTASVVGIVDGLVTAVTHPVDTVKGLGSMLWTISGLVPGPKMIYDVAVHGKSPLESLQDSAHGTLEVGKAMFAGAIEDVKAGNWAGAAGRLTGDVGSLFLGGAGAARAAAWAGKYGRVGAVGAKAITTLGRVVTVDAKLMELGAAGAGKLAGRLAKLPAADKLAAKLARVEKAIAADAKALKGGGHLDDAAKAERVVAQADTAAAKAASPAHAPAGALSHADDLLGPAARPHYAAPKYLENAKGRHFAELTIPKADGSFVKLKDVTLESVDGHLRFKTKHGHEFVTETMVDKLLYHPDNARLMDAVRAPEPKALLAVADQRFASFEIPRGDGSFTTIKDAKIAYVDGTHVYVYDGAGQGYRVPHDRMNRMMEHPGNQAMVEALEAKKVWERAPIDLPDQVLDGVALRPRQPNWVGTRMGGPIEIPTAYGGARGAVDGVIAGVSADGKLVTTATLPDGSKIAKELAPELAFKHNPKALHGYPWGTSRSGYQLVLAEFDVATKSFKTVAQKADGSWAYTTKRIPVDDVMRNARPFTDLPMVKVTPDVRVIPYDEIGISVGEGSGFKISSRADMANVQKWYGGHMKANAAVFDALKANGEFVTAVRSWAHLDDVAKVEVLQKAVKEFAQQNGIPTPDFKIVDSFPDGRSGQFVPATRGKGNFDKAPGTIELRRDMLKGNPADLLDTAIHEAAHGRQWHAVERYRAGVLDAASAEHFFASQFSDSWDRISSAGKDHYQGYRNNLIEQDAWSAGTDFGRRIAKDPYFMPVRPMNVRPTLDWWKLQDPVAVPGPRTAGRLERVVDGQLQLVDKNGVRSLHKVENVLGNNRELLNHLDFGTLPDGAPIKLGLYDPRSRSFAAWAFDQASGQWVAATHKFPLADVLRESRVFERLGKR